MSEFTSRFALPYPAETDTPDVPKDMKSLAEMLDKLIMPPGTLRLTAAETLEAGWLNCEGQAVSRTTYAALFAAIGTAFGEGDKSTTFNLPDFRERVPVGSGGATPRGSKGGSSTHTLTTAEIPAHTHASTTTVLIAAEGGFYLSLSGGAFTQPANQTNPGIGSTGGGAAHSIMQPYTGCNVWIKT